MTTLLRGILDTETQQRHESLLGAYWGVAGLVSRYVMLADGMHVTQHKLQSMREAWLGSEMGAFAGLDDFLQSHRNLPLSALQLESKIGGINTDGQVMYIADQLAKWDCWSHVSAWQQITAFDYLVPKTRTLDDLQKWAQSGAKQVGFIQVTTELTPTVEQMKRRHFTTINPHSIALRVSKRPFATSPLYYERRRDRPWTNRDETTDLLSDIALDGGPNYSASGNIGSQMADFEALRASVAEASESQYWKNHTRLFREVTMSNLGEEAAAATICASFRQDIVASTLPHLVKPQRVRLRFEKEFQQQAPSSASTLRWSIRLVLESEGATYAEAERALWGISAVPNAPPPPSFPHGCGPTVSRYIVLTPLNIQHVLSKDNVITPLVPHREAAVAMSTLIMVRKLCRLAHASPLLKFVYIDAAAHPDTTAALWANSFLIRGRRKWDSTSQRGLLHEAATRVKHNAHGRICPHGHDLLQFWGVAYVTARMAQRVRMDARRYFARVGLLGKMTFTDPSFSKKVLLWDDVEADHRHDVATSPTKEVESGQFEGYREWLSGCVQEPGPVTRKRARKM